MQASVVRAATTLVAIPTYRRPRMLRAALVAVARLHPPAGGLFRVLVIDNDPDHSAEPVVRAVAGSSPLFEYLCEPVRGLAAVRNRALDEAARRGALALAFLDDDEAPETDWLFALRETFDIMGADLVGGPVLPVLPREGLSGWMRWLFLAAWGGAVWRAVTRRIRAAWGGRITVTTNNWMVRLSFLQRHPLRFKAQFAISGGEDADFFREVIAAGGRTAWASAARVRETVPRSRLRCGYFFRRRFDSGLVRTGTVAAQQGRARAVLRFLPGSCLNVATGLVLLAISPLAMWLTLPSALGHLGRGSGYVAGLCGLRSQHYRCTVGY